MKKEINCDVNEFMNKFYDYRSIMDSIHSYLVEGIHEYSINVPDKQIFIVCNSDTSLWIKKLASIGVFEPKHRINYDGFNKNCIGLLDGHEVIINDNFGKGKIAVSDSADAYSSIMDEKAIIITINKS